MLRFPVLELSILLGGMNVDLHCIINLEIDSVLRSTQKCGLRLKLNSFYSVERHNRTDVENQTHVYEQYPNMTLDWLFIHLFLSLVLCLVLEIPHSVKSLCSNRVF